MAIRTVSVVWCAVGRLSHSSKCLRSRRTVPTSPPSARCSRTRRRPPAVRVEHPPPLMSRGYDTTANRPHNQPMRSVPDLFSLLPISNSHRVVDYCFQRYQPFAFFRSNLGDTSRRLTLQLIRSCSSNEFLSISNTTFITFSARILLIILFEPICLVSRTFSSFQLYCFVSRQILTRRFSLL